MNEGKNFGEIKGFNPQEDTIKEVVAEAEKIDNKNEDREGKGTVIIENKAGDKGEIKLSAEEVPNFEAKEDIEQKDDE